MALLSSSFGCESTPSRGGWLGRAAPPRAAALWGSAGSAGTGPKRVGGAPAGGAASGAPRWGGAVRRWRSCAVAARRRRRGDGGQRRGDVELSVSPWVRRGFARTTHCASTEQADRRTHAASRASTRATIPLTGLNPRALICTRPTKARGQKEGKPRWRSTRRSLIIDHARLGRRVHALALDPLASS